MLVGRSVGQWGAMLIDFLINKVCKLLAPHNSRGMIGPLIVVSLFTRSFTW